MSSRRNQLKRGTNSMTKTERLLEAQEKNEMKQQSNNQSQQQPTVIDKTINTPTEPAIWMLSASDIQQTAPALSGWSAVELEPTIAAVRIELEKAGAVIKSGECTGITIADFNKVCNSVISEMHKQTIMTHIEKCVRIDVIDVVGSGLKDPELTALIDNIVAKCYVQNIDPSDGEDYEAILDGFLDPVVDQIEAETAAVATDTPQGEGENPVITDVVVKTADTEVEVIVTESPKEEVETTASETVTEHTAVEAVKAYERQPLVNEDQLLPTTTDVILASNAGGQNTTLYAMVDGKEVEVESVRVRTMMQPYVPAFTDSVVNDSNIAFAAVDEFYEYRSPQEKKEVLLSILKAAGERFADNRMDELYVPMDGVNLRSQLTDNEITKAMWGSANGPFDPVFEVWSDLIAVIPRVKSLKMTRGTEGEPTVFGVVAA